MFSRIGIISFCSNWSNPVVWSHYAESHKGLCLGFDVEDEKIVSIDYVEDRLDADQSTSASVLPESDRLGARLIRTKFHHWAYEGEKRIIFDLNDPVLIREDGLLFASFEREMLLREVIIGAL